MVCAQIFRPISEVKCHRFFCSDVLNFESIGPLPDDRFYVFGIVILHVFPQRCRQYYSLFIWIIFPDKNNDSLDSRIEAALLNWKLNGVTENCYATQTR